MLLWFNDASARRKLSTYAMPRHQCHNQPGNYEMIIGRVKGAWEINLVAKMHSISARALLRKTPWALAGRPHVQWALSQLGGSIRTASALKGVYYQSQITPNPREERPKVFEESKFTYFFRPRQITIGISDPNHVVSLALSVNKTLLILRSRLLRKMSWNSWNSSGCRRNCGRTQLLRAAKLWSF